ncbi:hypothetical protein KHM83_16495 [Fusibacter paucivorans]|uniref:Uncharacterized protein n=1 Tax=Fusibacter paucivorans TaxID=76009 RepID=A0ABS5PSY5_9FIRM|nr:hypothetical protein [Fusibacter paucivorans]MBS7528290.1 hypothetical protein [Fusibacter paucivorans]
MLKKWITLMLIVTVISSFMVSSFAGTVRGRSDGPYPYKNMYGFTVGTYTYYNSEQCYQMAKNLDLQAGMYAVVAKGMATYSLNAEGETVVLVLSGRTFNYHRVAKKLYKAAKDEGAIIYTLPGNILTKIAYQ